MVVVKDQFKHFAVETIQQEVEQRAQLFLEQVAPVEEEITQHLSQCQAVKEFRELEITEAMEKNWYLARMLAAVVVAQAQLEKLQPGLI
jgi:hypothetical protein